MTIAHPLDFFFMLLAVICLFAAVWAPYAASPEPGRYVWVGRFGWLAAGLFFWALTVLLGYAGAR